MVETVNYCLKEFHLERGIVQAITTAHINTWADPKVNFKKLIWEAYWETSQFKLTSYTLSYLGSKIREEVPSDIKTLGTM